MNEKKQDKNGMTNPTIPQAATILKANQRQKNQLKGKQDKTDECNDATQTSV